MKRIVGILIGVTLFSGFTKANEFKDCSSLKEECFTVSNSPQSSFFIKSLENKKAAVLVHGLTDSPYFTKDLALLLSSNGYNVYSVLLSGHGTQVEELFQASSEKWLLDIKRTIILAMKDTSVSKVTLSGFSMGGVLVTALAEDSFWKTTISNLVLMAPAFKIKKSLGIAMCTTGAYRLKTWASYSTDKSPVRYNQMPFNAVCELTNISSIVRENAENVFVPTFMAVTDGDQTIDTESALNTFTDMSSQKKKLFHVKNVKTTHTDLVFKNDPIGNKKNPLFDEMGQRIIQFLK